MSTTKKKIDPNAALEDEAVAAEVAEEVGTEDVSNYLPSIRTGVGALEQSATPQVVDMTGVAPPFLAVVHGVGGLAQAGFNPGALVLAKEHLLVEKGQPLNITILKFDQYFKQYMTKEDFDSGIRPRTFKSLADAEAAGLNTKWDNAKGLRPEVAPAMDWLLLIEKPKDLICGLFGINILGKEYALALMTVDKTAHKNVAPTFLQAAKFSLAQRGIYSAQWEMKTMLQKSRVNPANAAWVPSIKLAGYHSQEWLDAARAALG